MKVGIIFGSKSDVDVMKGAADCLKKFGIEYSAHVLSAHRVPELLEETLEKLNKNVENSVNKLLNVTNEFENVIIVSNELGMGLVPSYPLGRYFREIAGKMNQIVAEKADEVYFVVSGISMKIK